MTRKRKIYFTRARLALQRLDEWADNAAYMIRNGNPIMADNYMDRVNAALNILLDTRVITEAEADSLFDLYLSKWEKAANSGRK